VTPATSRWRVEPLYELCRAALWIIDPENRYIGPRFADTDYGVLVVCGLADHAQIGLQLDERAKAASEHVVGIGNMDANRSHPEPPSVDARSRRSNPVRPDQAKLNPGFYGGGACRRE
jgi:hypothetical protein